MIRQVGLVTLGALFVAVLVHPAGAAVTQTKQYVAVAGDVNDTGPLPGGPTNDCSGSGPGLGGTCFVIPAGATQITLAIRDDEQDYVQGMVSFADGATPFANQVGDQSDFCDSVVVAVPPGATQVYVFTQQARLIDNLDAVLGGESPPLEDCSAATAGTVTLG